MPALRDLLHRSLACLALVLLGLSLAACGGDDDANGDGNIDAGPPADGGNDSSDDNPDGSDGSNGEDEFSAVLSPADELPAGETLVITFTEAVNRDTLDASGSLVANATLEWRSDTELALLPAGWWPPGEQVLRLAVESADGDTLALEETVSSVSPYATYQSASLVIGQPDFTSTAPRQSEDAPTADANTLDMPEGNVAYARAADVLYVPDTGDSRVLGFNGIPDTNNANADFVVGQPDFSSSSGATTRESYRSPQGISTSGGQLIVGDPNSNRLLVYEGYPQGPASAVTVIGQQNFEDFGDTCAAWNLNHVHHHFVTPAGRLIVTDSANNRVLVFNEVPTENGAEPDLVLGQSTFDQCAANDANQDGITGENERATASTLQHPSSAWSDDERLVVVDNYNNRVLIWNGFPQSNFEPADIVLGQAAMDMIAPNDDDQDGEADAQASARTLNYPWHAWVEQDRLIVSDENNHRVLVWNGWPAASFEPADAVLGQQDFEGTAANAGGDASAKTFNHPKGVRVIDGRLFVTDMQNSRVLVFDD